MGQIRDRIQTEIDNLTRQSRQMDEQYKTAKLSTESRLETLRKLLPKVTPEVEQLVAALGITL